ncbi:MAG: 4Fe-4S cluster-binding domain-containing protein [Candidatus Aureabacteria bacterium]|nr:4Fe-4S cluster-binding domain-containing protein [Candidatus Auribacterota bacterium]
MIVPSYINLHRSGELAHSVEQIYELQSPCRLCPRACGVMRPRGERGACGGGDCAKIFRCSPHFGEEPPITGSGGSGTIFFSGCTLNCDYCQNYTFSQGGAGREVACEELAQMFLTLAGQGCHNINLVTPTHFIPQILSALTLAVERGFDLPLVYNTSGYESLGTLRLLEGCVDVYLADMRYGSSSASARYSGAHDYPEINREAIREMWRQTGPLVTNAAGVALRGLIVRHLVLPQDMAGTREVARFLREEISPDLAVSLMSQYIPCHKAVGDPILGRRITEEEYGEAREIFAAYGFTNGWIQEWSGEGGDSAFLGARMEGNIHCG